MNSVWSALRRCGRAVANSAADNSGGSTVSRFSGAGSGFAMVLSADCGDATDSAWRAGKNPSKTDGSQSK